MKTALITGVTGQDGSYLSELLLSKGYQVCGVIRRSSSTTASRINHLTSDSFRLLYGDMTDASSLESVIHKTAPDEIYNLAAMSHVRISFDNPAYTTQVNAVGFLSLLESARRAQDALGKQIRIYQASSSELFGGSPPPQNEKTLFSPRSPYGVSKQLAHWFGSHYREVYNLFVCNGILFNHESPRRGEDFVTRKITQAVGHIYHGLQDKLVLGNLEAKRDWGHAKDYVEAMWMMLNAEKAKDYVIATGETHSIKEFLELAFGTVGLDWHKYVVQDVKYYRPAEVNILCGDASMARKELGWTPKTNFADLVKEMVEYDMLQAQL